ncbi:enoyl-CoA hydratase-related protein [Hyphomonas sp. UBA4494]|uniref:enoyl-CoA hydratase-related protein n=1 Tax=Hyphomonas sp. UBA4494 TaxID=1946631 RepID=UPI0025B9C9E6|nr:enoyl-CoA hydratase-related protein [Hyphomonas sp. UBA4494]
MPGYTIGLDAGIAHLILERPQSGNALGAGFWNGLAPDISALDRSGEVRAMVLSSGGRNFCAGMDLDEFAGGIPEPDSPGARESFYHLALSLQETFSCLERARFPVFAAIQGACLGAGLELAAACDLRYATRDSYFRIEEINTGIMADVGALQRLPKILPEPVVKEMAFLGETLHADEAAQHGFVTRLADTPDAAIKLAMAAADQVCRKAPVAIAGTKAALRWARDHSVADSLEWSARTQSALWSTHDISAALRARKARTDPLFEPLLAKPVLGGSTSSPGGGDPQPD